MPVNIKNESSKIETIYDNPSKYESSPKYSIPISISELGVIDPNNENRFYFIMHFTSFRILFYENDG